MRKLIILPMLLLLAGGVSALVITVPGDYPSIQQAITAAQNGDTILVSDGVYTGSSNKNLQFLGKTLTLMSENGPENCIIDCQNSGKAFLVQNSNPAGEDVIGFTMKNGSSGGAFLYNALTHFTNCWFFNNASSGVICSASNALFDHCVFKSNSNSGTGGGIIITSCSPTITNCTFYGNSANIGGAMYLNSANPIINSTIISYNTVSG